MLVTDSATGEYKDLSSCVISLYVENGLLTVAASITAAENGEAELEFAQDALFDAAGLPLQPFSYTCILRMVDAENVRQPITGYGLFTIEPVSVDWPIAPR